MAIRELTNETEQRVRAQAALLAAAVALITALLVIYAETMAFAWDEGFHVLTAQLILRGKRPYLDFLFPQTTLNAYWSAGWMRVFGESWRTIHAAAALCTAGAVALMVDYALRRPPVVRWRFAAAFAVAVMFGLNVLVIQFGTLGQAYGFCLLLIAAAFRFTTAAVARPGWMFSALGGLFAGAAAASSLLTAPVAPVLLIWLVIYNTAGKRLTKAVAFVVGAAIPFAPMVYLFVQSPRLVLFNIIDYHLFYRQVEWPGAIHHDVRVMLSWVNSGQAVILILLAAAGLLFVFRSDWSRARRAEVYLCGWLAVALALHISSAHPTFGRYYLFTVPFLAVPAFVGMYAATGRLYSFDRPLPALLVVAAIFSIALTAELLGEAENFNWPYMETVARKVDEVTPRGAPLLADEHIYFITRRMPPSGMELGDSHKLEMPKLANWAHFVGWSELKRRMEAGAYVTAETCHDDAVRELGPKVFTEHADMQECDVYWSPKR